MVRLADFMDDLGEDVLAHYRPIALQYLRADCIEYLLAQLDLLLQLQEPFLHIF